MTEGESNQNPGEEAPPAPPPAQASWKPLAWLVGAVAVLVGLGDLLLDALLHGGGLLLDLVEVAYLALVEAPEELVEDAVEDWLGLEPLDAEIVVFWTLTPLKILVGFLLLRWLWRWTHSRVAPRCWAWLHHHSQSVRLAWNELPWYWKGLAMAAALSSLFLVI